MIPGGINPLMGALMQAQDEEDLMEQASAFSRAMDPRAAVNALLLRLPRGESKQSEALGDMFSPPIHLIHKGGGFQGARAVAKDSKRWLLVNIQKDSEFSSHALNRDVWRDDLVENLIREGFIFFQTVRTDSVVLIVLLLLLWYVQGLSLTHSLTLSSLFAQMDTTTEGRTFCERYQVHDYPHVSIIDPRTGRLMWRREGWTQERPLTKEDFAEMAMDFCSRHSLDNPPSASHKRKSRSESEEPASLKREESVEYAASSKKKKKSRNQPLFKRS